MNIKVKDIAIKSGVSMATVSRYLNKSGYEKAAKEIEEQIAHTVSQGARLVYGGQRDGAFVTPAVLMDVTKDMDVAKDMEIFGPVFPIIGFDTEEEALKIANQTIYGLNAGCLTADMTRSLRVA